MLFRSPRFARRILQFLVAGVASLTLTAAVAQSERKPESSIPPWKRQLNGEAAARVEKLEQRITQLYKQGQFAALRASVRRHRRAQGGSPMLRSMTPKRATTSLAASVDPIAPGKLGRGG